MYYLCIYSVLYYLCVYIDSDRQELVSLEQLLASNREKEFQAQLAVQETSSEVQLMKDRLTLNDSKM